VITGGEVVIHSSSDTWSGREGYVDIHIENSIGETRDLHIVVLSDSDSTPTAMAHG
jgi:hypothetical protein